MTAASKLIMIVKMSQLMIELIAHPYLEVSINGVKLLRVLR